MLNILSGYFFFQCEQHASDPMIVRVWAAESNRYIRESGKMSKRNVAQLAGKRDERQRRELVASRMSIERRRVVTHK